MSNPNTTQGLCYTPRSFTDVFASLLTRHHPFLFAVSLTLGPEEPAVTEISPRHSFPGAWNESNTPEGEWVTVLASFYGKAREHSDATAEERSPPLLHMCRIVAHTSSLTARWCAELQRVFSLVACLQGETDQANLSDPSGAPPTQTPTSQTEAPLTEGENVSSTQPKRLNRERPMITSLDEFHVVLFPFLPEMHYVRRLDGVLGAQHYCSVRGTVTWSEAASHTRLPDTLASQETDKEAAASPSSQGFGEDEEARDALGGAAMASFRPRKVHKLESHGEAQTQRQAGQLPDSCHHGGGRDTHSKGHGQQRMRSSPCRAAALLNANIPMPATATVLREETEAGSSSSGGREEPFALVVLHAPGRSLATCSTCFPSHVGKGDGSEAALTFDFMKSFTTNYLVPQLNLGAANATLQTSQWSASMSATATGKKELTAAATSSLADNVCGIAALGTSYWLYPIQRARGCGRVKNVVFVLDIPIPLWHHLKNHALTPSSLPSQAGTNEDRGATAVMAASTQLVRLLDSALLQLVKENVDLFAFRHTSASDPEGNDAAAPRARGPTATAAYSDDVLIRSIAESVASIIGASPNLDFVRAAEGILFPSAAPGAGRFSAAEVRWAIEERLHHVTSQHPLGQ